MQPRAKFKTEKEFERFMKLKSTGLCKYIGHNYCPDKIKLEAGAQIVNIEFKCRRCGNLYRKLYPSTWDKEVNT